MDTLVITELGKVLEQEANIYNDILELSKSKTRIIIDGKVNELENIVKLEQSLIIHMGKLEEMRERLIGEISGLLGEPEITLSGLLKHVDGVQGDKFKKLQANIMNIVNDLKNTNEVNSKLIKNSLEYIDFSINLFANLSTNNNNYGKKGETSEYKKRSFFDVKL